MPNIEFKCYKYKEKSVILQAIGIISYSTIVTV